MKIEVQLSSELKTKKQTKDLIFGQTFTDHMYTAEFKNGSWQNAKIAPYRNLEMSPAASVLHYGQALFEGMKAYKQDQGDIVVLNPAYNARRMQAGAQRLCMEAPSESDFTNAVKELVSIERDWVPSGEGASLYIRPTLIATEGFLGVRPAKEFLFFIILSPSASYFDTAGTVKIWIEKTYTRAAPGGLGATKAAANYASSLLAAQLAKQKGYHQVLWLDTTREHVEEVGTMNVFFVVNKKILTPKLDGTILAGGVRSLCLELLKESGYDVEETQVSVKKLSQWYNEGILTEAFGTGTAATISPISELHSDDIKMSFPAVGPVGAFLKTQLFNLFYGRVVDSKKRLMRV